MGKFQLFWSHSEQNYYFLLKSGNGEVILKSDGYTTKQACLEAIEAVRNNAMYDERYERVESLSANIAQPERNERKDNLAYSFSLNAENGEISFRLKTGNGEIILSNEGFVTKVSCLDSSEPARPNASADESSESNDDDSFSFSLKTENGELIGHSADYTTRHAREAGIEAVKNFAQIASTDDLT